MRRAPAPTRADGTIEGAAFVTIATQHNAIGHVEHDAGGDRRERRHRARRAREHRAGRALGGRRPRRAALEHRLLGCRGTDAPLAPVISWQDRRGAAWLKGLARRAEDVQRTDRPASYRRTTARASCAGASTTCRKCAAPPRSRRLRAGPLASYLLHRLLRGAAARRRCVDGGAHAALVAVRTRLVGRAARTLRHPARDAAARDRHLAGVSARSPATAAGMPVDACNGDQSVVPFAAGPLDSTPPTSTSAPAPSCCARRRRRCAPRRC